jgi:hypothetical protein
MTKKPADHHVVAAAIVANAAVIVTTNLDEFPVAFLPSYEIET